MSDLRLPDALQADLNSDRTLSIEQKARLGALLKAVETPIPDLYDSHGIREANRLWTSEHVRFYLGQESPNCSPGNIDPQLAIIIGQAEPDSPIALDFRCSLPRVVYFGDAGYWVELFPNYESLIAAISG